MVWSVSETEPLKTSLQNINIWQLIPFAFFLITYIAWSVAKMILTKRKTDETCIETKQMYVNISIVTSILIGIVILVVKQNH
jgi:hypothetical protein